MTFETMIKNIERICYLTKSGILFQIVGAAKRQAQDAVSYSLYTVRYNQ